jgi:hypothetical protein
MASFVPATHSGSDADADDMTPRHLPESKSESVGKLLDHVNTDQGSPTWSMVVLCNQTSKENTMSESLPILKVSADQRELLERIAHINEEALKPDGFESCVVGMLRRFNDDPIVLLDANKCIRVLMERDGMEEEEAREFFEFNTIGAWVGPGTPAFVEYLIHDTTEAEEYLLKLLNKAWSLIPEHCLRREFKAPMLWPQAYEKLQILKVMERETYPFIDTLQVNEGMTVMSCFVMINGALSKKQMDAQVDDEGMITGWTWWSPTEPESEPEEASEDM